MAKPLRKAMGIKKSEGPADPSLRQLKLRLEVDVHPARTHQSQDALRDELNSRLMRCDAVLFCYFLFVYVLSAYILLACCFLLNALVPPAIVRSRYDDRVQGVVLSYWDERLEKPRHVRLPRIPAARLWRYRARYTNTGSSLFIFIADAGASARAYSVRAAGCHSTRAGLPAYA